MATNNCFISKLVSYVQSEYCNYFECGDKSDGKGSQFCRMLKLIRQSSLNYLIVLISFLFSTYCIYVKKLKIFSYEL